MTDKGVMKVELKGVPVLGTNADTHNVPVTTSPPISQSAHSSTITQAGSQTLAQTQHTPSYHNFTVKQAPDTHTKFDGRQVNSETWFANARDIATSQGMGTDDLVLINAAVSLIDFKLADNPTVVAYGLEDARQCKNWVDFQNM